MKCPVGRHTCGGKLALEIFFTGVTARRGEQEVASVKQVRIVFILTISGKIFFQHHVRYSHNII